MKKITWVIFLCAFILFRPYQLQSSGMLYSNDDESYMAHATSLAFFQFPSYAKESFPDGKGVPKHSIGPSLLALPFVFSFSIIDRITGNDIVNQRTQLNVSQSWAAFGFTISSIFYLWLTCLLLYKGLKFFFSSQISALTVILAILVQGVPLFALRRPVFSHIYEIFLQSLFIFMLFRLNRLGYILSGDRVRYFRESVLIGLLISLITLVRVNNILISLTWPIILFSFYRTKISWMKISRMILFSYLFIPIAVFIFQIWPIIHNLPNVQEYKGYFNCPSKTFLVTLQTPFFYLKQLWHIIWGIDFGLIFSAPYLLLGLASLVWIKKDRIYACSLILLIPLLVNLYVTFCFRYGSWYGYRYLIFSLLPIIVYPLAYTLSSLKQKKYLFLFYAIILLSIFPILSMISFEGDGGNLTLKLTQHESGVIDYSNNTYQAEIYKMILTRPAQYLSCIFKAGPCYLIYLFSLLLKANKYLPAVIYEKYIAFQLAALIKTMIVYLFPFALFLVYKKIASKGCDEYSNC